MYGHVQMSRFSELPTSAADQISELHQQNDNLRQVVRHMRQEVETISNQLPTGGGGTDRSTRKSSVAEGVFCFFLCVIF